MNTAFEALQTASHKLAEVLYQQQAGEGEATEQASSSASGGDYSATAGSDECHRCGIC